MRCTNVPSARSGKIISIAHYPEQVVIYYEGGLALWPRTRFDNSPLKIGDEFYPEAHIEDGAAYQQVLTKAYQLLAIRDYPLQEMRHKLTDIPADPKVIESVLVTLIQRQLLDDQRYAEHQLAKVLEMGYGSLHLKSVLLEKGIPTDIVDAVVHLYDNQQETELAHRLVHEWVSIATLKQKSPANFASSLFNRLKTRGFRDDILSEIQEDVLRLARQHSVYDLNSQLEVYRRLKFSAYKMSAKLRALGYDEDTIHSIVQEVQND